ncbi:Cna B-type domain-containing protein [Trueperella pyogenes]|uniref:Cna B-type domain-containing protein n=1 Tax=Trueperella pyogenes TaxID=1661 RepID=UPI000F88A881|nr:Cna B-type domain-containing protein [Trueperella pyogenes]
MVFYRRVSKFCFGKKEDFMGLAIRRNVALVLLALLMLLAVVVPPQAAQAAQKCVGQVSNFHWKSGQSEFIGHAPGNEIARVEFDWSVNPGANPGESFSVTLPDELEIRDSEDIILRSPEGFPVAEGTWSGKTVRFTLTEYADDFGHIKGNAFFTVAWDSHHVSPGKSYSLNFRSCGHVAGTLKGKVLQTGPGGDLQTNGKTGIGDWDKNKVRWAVFIASAQEKDVYSPVQVIDQGGAGYSLTCEGLVIKNRNLTIPGSPQDHPIASERYACHEDGKGGIRVTMNPLSDGRYIANTENLMIEFSGKLLPGYKELDELVNTAQLTGTPTGDTEVRYAIPVPGAGGEGSGKRVAFSLRKMVEGNGNVKAKYDFSYKCRGDEFIPFAQLSNGEISKTVHTRSSATCYIREDNLPEGAAVSYSILNPDSGATVTMEKGLAKLEFVPDSKVMVQLVATNKFPESESVTVSVEKMWKGDRGYEENRPQEIVVELRADGTLVDGGRVSIKPDSKGRWNHEFTGLPKYSEGDSKKPIKYEVKEVNVPDGYTSKVIGDQSAGFTVVNTYTPETVSVEGVKTWDDANNQDGLRPASIQVQLLANGKPHGKPVEVKADEKGEWKYSFADLPKFAEGKQIVYSVAEIKVPEGYVSKADGMNLKNTHKPATVSVEGTKTWDDANNQDGKRPESITIRLLKNGVEADSRTVTAAQKWAWSFTDLPKFDKGQEIVYTITEDAVSGYSAKMSGYNVTNTYTPGKTSVGVAKSWQDRHDQDGLRPESVQVQLLADGKPVEGKVLTLKAANNWAGTFTELEEFKAGKKIAYSVAEVSVPKGYTSQVAGDATRGYTVTNTHTPAVTAIPVLKVWDDADNKDGLRPDLITVRLLANGKPVEGQSLTLTKDNAWKGQFAELPVNKDGKPVEYSVVEDKVDGYTSKVESADGVVKVTNTHTSKADAPALAFTGATVGGLAGAALLSLLTGMAFVLVNRRKKS